MTREIFSFSLCSIFTDFYCLLAHLMFDVMESAWCCNRRPIMYNARKFCAVQAMCFRLWMPRTTYISNICLFVSTIIPIFNLLIWDSSSRSSYSQTMFALQYIFYRLFSSRYSLSIFSTFSLCLFTELFCYGLWPNHRRLVYKAVCYRRCTRQIG